MTLLRDDLIQLRAIEPEDLDVLYRWENNADLWEVGRYISSLFQICIAGIHC